MSNALLLLSAAIQARREVLGWSQERLADKCGFDRTYISMLERGKRNPSLLNLLKLANGLGISISKLTTTLSNRLYKRWQIGATHILIIFQFLLM